MKKFLLRFLAIAILAAAGWYGYRYFKQLPQRQENVATAKVQRGDVVIRAFSRGELRAVRSVTLTAPNLFSTVQVTRLAPLGSLAKEKDLIVEFDDSERRASLEETLLEVEQIDEQIKKAKADLAIRNNQDQVDLLRQRYAVRRAELEVKRNELVSAIDAKKNLLTLEEAKRKLAQLESDIKSRREQAEAQLAVLQETRNKSMIDVQREKQRIAQSKVLSPMTGLVAIKQNRSGFFMFGSQVPDIREGDTLQPGMPVADVLDLSELEVVAKVGELDRANLYEGQDAILQLDAVPDKQFRGKIKSLSGTASSNVFSGDPSKKFDVVFSIDMRQLLTGLGMKPAEVDRIMATAAKNAQKAPSAPPVSMMAMLGGRGAGAEGGGMPGGMPDAMGGMPGGMGGMPGGMGMMPGGMGGQEGGGEERGGGARRGPGRRAGGGGEAGKQGAEGARRGGEAGKQGAEGARRGGEAGKQGAEGARRGGEAGKQGAEGARRGGEAGAPGGEGFRGGRRGGEAGAPGGEGFRGGRRGGEGGPPTDRVLGGANPLELMRRASAAALQFSDEDREKAKLPLPPEEDSQLQALLRPGLLADVEIIVEKIPNALHVPAQAVFEKNGKPTVFVQQKNKRFEPREVKLVKRSESMMVLAGGVEPGEIVALSDPTASKTEGKKGKGDKKGSSGSGSGPMNTMPSGGGKKQ